MYAYLIIGVELAILYAVFWYVFIREPRPYTLKGDLWGTYSQSSFTACDDYALSSARQWEHNMEVLSQIQSGHALNQMHQSNLPMKPIENTKQYGWVLNKRDAEAGAVAKLFGRLSESVEVMSVKVP
ncbi:MAG TPA: hypothetical protein V6C89_04640 [Drouetiella sp.]